MIFFFFCCARGQSLSNPLRLHFPCATLSPLFSVHILRFAFSSLQKLLYFLQQCVRIFCFTHSDVLPLPCFLSKRQKCIFKNGLNQIFEYAFKLLYSEAFFPTHQFPKQGLKERAKMKCKDNERRCESHWSIMAAGHVVMYAWLIFSHTFKQCVSLGQLYKSLLCASSNPKLCCSSYLIGYALFAALREKCASLSLWICVWETVVRVRDDH